MVNWMVKKLNSIEHFRPPGPKTIHGQLPRHPFQREQQGPQGFQDPWRHVLILVTGHVEYQWMD